MTREERADCVVVGGGPAGAVSALLLARAGFSVILLDRKSFPRAKPCGDCISPQANLLLRELGLWPEIEALQPARLRGWRIVAPSGQTFSARFEECTSDAARQIGLAVERQRFDHVLLEAARTAGVRVCTELRVDQLVYASGAVHGVLARSLAGEPLRIRAPLTIGADGLRSTVRQRLNLTARAPRLHKVSFTAHARGVAGLGDLGEMHVLAGACVGLAPVDTAGSACNITLVLDARQYGHSFAGKPLPRFAEMLGRFPGLRGRLGSLALQDAELLASGPFDRPSSDVIAPGAALVGDAAGYFDPFTGQGIYQALADAFALARAAQPALRARAAQRPLRAYAAAHARLLRGARAVQRGVDWVCARPACADHCIRALDRAPRAAARLIGVTGDLAPAASLLSPAALLSFLLGFTTRSSSL